MDRFLDEQESPATMDRVSLPAVSAADCEQVTGQHEISGFPADDSKSCSDTHADSKPVALHNVDGDAKLHASSGECLTVANNNKVDVLPSSSDSSTGESVAGSAAVAVSINSYVDADTDLSGVDANAEATLHSADSHTTSASDNLCKSTESAVVLPPCSIDNSESLTGSRIERLETEKVDTGNSESAATTSVLGKDQMSSDSEGDVLEPSARAVSSSSATTVTVYDQQCLDDKPVSESHEAHDTASDPTPMSVSVDTEQSTSTIMQESQAVVGSATAADMDEVKPDDVEQLMAAVDSATSVADSLYSNVDPMTAALEFSSSVSASVELPSCQQTDSFTSSNVQSSSQVTDSQPSESVLSPHSSNGLPVSVSDSSVSTSCLPPNDTNVSLGNALKQDDVSVACESGSTLIATKTDVMHDAERDMELPIGEPPVTVIPTSTRDVNQDVVLLDVSDSGNKLHLGDQVVVVSIDEDKTASESTNLSDDVPCRQENELTSLNPNHLAETCLQSTNVSVSGLDASTMQADITDVTSVETNSDNISFSLAAGDVTLLDKLGDKPCPHEEAEQCENTDGRTLLTVPSDVDCASTAL